MIDSHCHLEMRQFDDDREAVIQRARDCGIEAMMTIGADVDSSTAAIRLANAYPFIYATVGIHPHNASTFAGPATYEQLKGLCADARVVAVGETGLDYHYDHSPRHVQRDVFVRHMELAQEVSLPLVIHSREANQDTLGLIKSNGVNNAVLHCFSGDMQMAEVLVAQGLYISFSGVVTFKKAEALRDIARMVPDDLLLIETDAPYLAPQPYRGKRNEPSYLRYTAEVIAQMRGISPQDVARITSNNAKRLFGVGKVASSGTITYKIRDSLYINLTNRCTNECVFCIRYKNDFVKGHNMRLSREPEVDEIVAAIGDPTVYREVVFCGYGEPLIRADVVRGVAAYVKARGGMVRVNTNGQGNIINDQDVLPQLSGLVDHISVSLNAQDAKTYELLCKPLLEGAYEGLLRFVREARQYIPVITLTVVEMPGVDVAACQAIARDLGVNFRVRHLDVVG
ncbi:MAG: YchF/TatD family DNA exonuclease [Nitrospirae bacterium]|uniref:TatD related Dnase n=2 Tax=Nitrospirota TaxID=40117 RepID=A0A142BTY8_9BACT|nr:TatD family hydrolase [Candidatus Magnetobacterium casensis]AIM41348.1 TatD related DNase [Candidatus Magnetobacterium casensis]AMP41576.1 TatD related Dnase [uncultured Nitrospirota bacterium]MBF0337280.1 YchF/TatD family DNA exonuclease [Nitrospirota bacterium]